MNALLASILGGICLFVYILVCGILFRSFGIFLQKSDRLKYIRYRLYRFIRKVFRLHKRRGIME